MTVVECQECGDKRDMPTKAFNRIICPECGGPMEDTKND